MLCSEKFELKINLLDAVTFSVCKNKKLLLQPNFAAINTLVTEELNVLH